MTLSVGDRAPDFGLPAANGATVALSELLSTGPVVLFFYPKDDSPGCTVEACAFRDNHENFTEAGAKVVGISADSVASHGQFASKYGLPMTLLSDVKGEVRALYDVRRTLGLIPGRATFVIDREGVVRFVLASQLRWDAHCREALAAVRGLGGSGGRGKA